MPLKIGAKVFLGIPFYQTIEGAVVDGYDDGVDPRGEHQYVKCIRGDSFLARGFNGLWAQALNDRGGRKITHFSMIHADVKPHTPYWIDVLVEEMRKNGADLLSVVLPIKTMHGLTSTAIYERSTGNIRRLTMHEVCNSPEPYPTPPKPSIPQTFDGPTAAQALGLGIGWDLLPSTGLWICDFTSSWVEKVWFEVRDRILRYPDGEFYVETLPDDWGFALKLHKLGLRLMSTKAVVCGHWGPVEFRNDVAWGTLKQDDHVGSFSWLGEEL